MLFLGLRPKLVIYPRRPLAFLLSQVHHSVGVHPTQAKQMVLDNFSARATKPEAWWYRPYNSNSATKRPSTQFNDGPRPALARVACEELGFRVSGSAQWHRSVAALWKANLSNQMNHTMPCVRTVQWFAHLPMALPLCRLPVWTHSVSCLRFGATRRDLEISSTYCSRRPMMT